MRASASEFLSSGRVGPVVAGDGAFFWACEYASNAVRFGRGYAWVGGTWRELALSCCDPAAADRGQLAPGAIC